MVRRRAPQSSLATVLFVDVVDSTPIASSVGDRRWAQVLRKFRAVVRGAVKAEGGREQDTAGDGFFATFDRPAAAVRAAAAVVAASQGLGVDVRCGIHTGELERIEGRLGGVAAHIGARVIAHAGAAEILLTNTVRELLIGGGIVLERLGEAELKGVPGPWLLYRAVQVDGRPLPPPLPAAETGSRLAPLDDLGSDPRQRKLAIYGLTAAAGVAAIVIGALFMNGSTDRVPASSGAPTAPVAAERPPSVIKVDASTNTVVAEVTDRYLAIGRPRPLFIVDGVLWQDLGIGIVRRDVATGEDRSFIDAPGAYSRIPAFGSLWFDLPAGSGRQFGNFQRVDPISGRPLASVLIEERIQALTLTRDAVWFLTDEAVIEVDADTMTVSDRDPHGLEGTFENISALAGELWLCDCDSGIMVAWDAATDAPGRRFEFAQRGYFVEDIAAFSLATAERDESTVWLHDPEAGTVTSVDVRSGEAGRPISVPRDTGPPVFGLGAVWTAAEDQLYRSDMETGETESLELPDGFHAAGVAVDDLTESVWIANFVPEGEWMPPPLGTDVADE